MTDIHTRIADIIDDASVELGQLKRETAERVADAVLDELGLIGPVQWCITHKATSPRHMPKNCAEWNTSVEGCALIDAYVAEGPE